MRIEPLTKWVVEKRESEHHGTEGCRREVLGVLGAVGDAGDGGEGEDEGRDGGERVGREERREKREVFGGHDDGDGEEAGGGEVVGQV